MFGMLGSTRRKHAQARLSGEALVDTDELGGVAFTTLTFNTDGTIDKDEGGTVTQVDPTTDWVIPNEVAPDDYEVMAVLDSGTPPTGSPLSTWLALTSTRAWGISQSGDGTTQCQLTISIRRGGGAVLDTGVFTMFCDVTTI